MFVVACAVTLVAVLWINYFSLDRFGGEEQHEENRVHLGNAIMSFYSALIDLLGRCAPEMHVRDLIAGIEYFCSICSIHNLVCVY